MNKTCAACSQSFEITQDDLAFYQKVSPVFAGKRYDIPPPTYCPQCRDQRRLSIVNIRNLYTRKADDTGKDVVSIYAPDAPMTVCEAETWWSDSWDPMQYGKDFDFSRPFFEQMKELIQSVPIMSLIVHGNQNSPFVNYAGWNQNCHMCFCTDHSEKSMYCQDCYYAKHTLDCAHSYNLELCYECTDCSDCYNVRNAQQSANCSDSAYLYDCLGCRNCTGCVGLRQKEYCYLNEQLTKDAYEERLKSVFDEPAYKKLLAAHPRKAMIGLQNERSFGNYLLNCKNAQACYDCNGMEDSKFCTNMKGGGKDCYDVYRWGHPAELCYECCGVGEGVTHFLFDACCWDGKSDVYYGNYCISSDSCFGCCCIRHKKYCILNKQYTKEQYEELVPKIIAHMQKTGEWGEFFPPDLFPFGYNETPAQEYYPMTKEQVETKGWKWRTQEHEMPKVEKVIPGAKLPSSIKDIPDDILNWAVTCEVTGRPFRIIKQELAFYRERGLPVPHVHPDERHNRRMALRNPRTLWKRQCAKCKKDVQTTYDPKRPEIVYCEQCYLDTVY
ncbi:MAG: hypothetical protein HOO67_06490 [Candidatus Peribacteraceae bacterium]|nr:hypothetical protein [Candidatus Peribacteraceae bacterium]